MSEDRKCGPECFHPDHFVIWRPDLFAKIQNVWPAPGPHEPHVALLQGKYVALYWSKDDCGWNGWSRRDTFAEAALDHYRSQFL